MLPYGIGLDIGITSVGWTTVALDENDRPYGIIGMGSRIFDAAEQPKTGESLAAPRREARSARRRLRRHRHRNERIRALVLRENLLSDEQLREYAKKECHISESDPLYQDEEMRAAIENCAQGKFEEAYKVFDQSKNK